MRDRDGREIRQEEEEDRRARRSATTRRDEPDEDEDDDRRPSRRRRGFSCRYCGSTYPPMFKQRISTGGWVLLFMIFIFPLNFFGLALKEEYRVCGECGAKLD